MIERINIIVSVLLAGLGLALGPLNCRILNKIPAKWLCDYDEEPSQELLSGKRYKLKPHGIAMSLTLAVILAITSLTANITATFPIIIIILLVLMLIAASDAKYTIIPDEFTIAAAVLSLIFAVTDLFTAQNFITTWYTPILGGLCGGAVLIALDLFSTLIFKKAGFGFGDVKLMAALGIMFGYKYVFILLVFSCMMAACHFVAIIFAGKAKKGIYLPMGPYICLGTCLVIIMQPYFETLFNMYRSLMEMQVLP
ncbi:MAG: A24 family peptidase [Acutalibacteraceae bacterium]|nr:prepilin peptidase [Clostridia bacterium]MEE3450545.1 A24 family peptidase [Acutalibacteraceae bacterium]